MPSATQEVLYGKQVSVVLHPGKKEQRCFARVWPRSVEVTVARAKAQHPGVPIGMILGDGTLVSPCFACTHLHDPQSPGACHEAACVPGCPEHDDENIGGR